MIEYIDKRVGLLVAKLDALGLRENTIVIFTGEFYDLRSDSTEEHPLKVADLGGEAAAGAEVLRGVLDEFAKIKPPQLA